MNSATTFDPSYIAGLLDGIARIRFDYSHHDDNTYTIRPFIRINPHGTEIRAAVIGTFLEEYNYQYDYVDRDYGARFFHLKQQSDLENLQEFLRGRSAHLIRELEFANGVFSEEFGYKILQPDDFYRFLLTRDKLRYGWQPRSPRHISPEYIANKYNLSTNRYGPMSLPAGDVRPNYGLEWIAGLFDGLCRYRLHVAQSEEYAINYVMYPVARMYRGGVHSQLAELYLRFCEDYNLSYGNLSGDNNIRIIFSGPAGIRRVLEVIFSQITVLLDPSEDLVNDILLRFDNRIHTTKMGFYQIIRDFDPIAQETGGPFRHRDYHPEFFADIWQDELDLTRDLLDSDVVEQRSPLDSFEGPEQISIPAEEYTDDLGRYQTLVDRRIRNPTLVRELKSVYKNQCQICNARLASSDGTGYSEAHHIHPLGEPHNGPDTLENMLVLCPNHHADFDNGVISINTEDFSIEHPYDSDVDSKSIVVSSEHNLSEESLQYHNENLFQIK